MSAGLLATRLDQKMIEQNCQISPASVPNDKLPIKSGITVSQELCGRYLVRYLLARDEGRFQRGSNERHWVTPTPYSSEDAIMHLALRRTKKERRSTLLLDPVFIPEILGPRWVEWGDGIEYILPHGFPARAVVWEIKL